MTDSHENIIERLTNENPEIVKELPDLFLHFARSVAPIISVLESSGIKYNVSYGRNDMTGWSIDLLPDVPDSQSFGVRTNRGCALSVMSHGIFEGEVCTPEDLVRYTQRRLNIPSPS